MEVQERLDHAYKSLKDKIPYRPQAALVLGSGLGGFADDLTVDAVIPYNMISGFPVSTVQGHKGCYVFARIGNVPSVIMQGRVHYYEGYDIADVVMPVRLMGMMGAEYLMLTNAAGGVNKEFVPGDLMMITDHISKFVPSCLVGKNPDSLGVRFPDMSRIYDPKLCGVIEKCAEKCSIDLKKGVYLQFTGPEYETPAEIRMASVLGADAVGMSTACEAVAANHMGMKICGISCVTNMASGISEKPLDHKEVQEIADSISEKFRRLVHMTISEFEYL